MVPQTTIDSALCAPALLGAALGDLASWQVWRAVLKAAFGLDLNDDEARAFASVAGNRQPPGQRVRELWAIVGRRGGKSRMAAAIAVFLAVFVNHRLSPGERGMVLVLAASTDQARTVFEYAKAFLEVSPVLRQKIVDMTKSEIRLQNNITVAIHSNSFRTIKGRTLCGCVFDEVAIWRDESSATPDVEVYRAVLPASLLTTKGMLIGISTGYRRVGLLYQKHRDYFGQDNADMLVVQGSTQAFNNTIDQADIDAQVAADPVSAVSEWGGGFRDDLSSYLADDLIDAAIDTDRPLELPPQEGVVYVAFVDAAAGASDRGDAYTLAIGHQDGENFVVDLVRGVLGKYDPHVVTEQYAALLRQYHIRTVTGDNYASQWVSQYWRKAGFEYQKSPWDKSELYIDVLPLFSGHRVRMPNHPRTIRELRLLERTTGSRGNDVVNHPKSGGHDDHSNVACGVLCLLKNRAAVEESIPTTVPFVVGSGGHVYSDPSPATAGQSRDPTYLRRNTYMRAVQEDEPGVAWMKSNGVNDITTWTGFRASRAAALGTTDYWRRFPR
jgi:hypothetical protein